MGNDTPLLAVFLKLVDVAAAVMPPRSGAGLDQSLVPPGVTAREPNVVGSAGWTRSIPVDFIEREEVYVVRADIPGVKKSEIHVDTHDRNVLRFGHNPHASREEEDEEESGVFHRAERVSSFRNRNLRMPENADLEGDIQATYENGVLEIIVPKKPVERQPPPTKRINVQ